MNWGKGIIAAFILFAVFIIFFVVKMMGIRTDGVPDDYYEKGNHYQEVIDASSGATRFGPRIQYNGQTHSFSVFFDSLSGGQIDSLNVEFLWPPDSGKNIRAVFGKLTGNAGISIPCNGPEGGWNGELIFYSKGIKYMYRQKVWVE